MAKIGGDAGRGGGQSPKLSGSPTQVEWATDIRRRITGQLDAMGRENAAVLRASREERRAYRNLQSSLRRVIANRTSAGWWIDRRGWSVRQILRDQQGS